MAEARILPLPRRRRGRIVRRRMEAGLERETYCHTCECPMVLWDHHIEPTWVQYRCVWCRHTKTFYR